jgi:hypothetical protein
VWQLEDAGHRIVDCVAGQRADGQVEVVVESGAPVVAKERGLFPDATAAVRWAFELQGTLISQGWVKVV